MATRQAASESDGFAELKPPLSRDEALAEANRCLYCYDAPCMRACPTHIDIPRFIKQIASDNLRGSARTILAANILGASCARVCPTEELCEGACVMHDVQARPIDIGRLQRYATDPVVIESGGRPLFSRVAASRPHKVAVVGAGPAGLGCAAELVQLGYAVKVLDADDKPGGLNTYGVADYKMQVPTALQEVAWVEQLGVEIERGVRVGRDVAVEKLLADYDALFLGIGLGGVTELGLEGESLEGSEDALVFIRRLKTGDKASLSLAGKRVAVLGGGNTAIDGVTQSARLGADKVYMVYRRGREQMKAYDHEIELARLDGAELVLWAQPVAIEGKDGKVTGVRCRRTEVGGDGKLREVAGSESASTGRQAREFVLEVDLVLRATGQAKLVDFLSTIEGLETDRSGRVVVDESGRTSHPKIWSGGDCANGGKEVVNAVAEGKLAARSIHDHLEAQ